MINFFEKRHKYIAIDIGATAIKLLDVDRGADDSLTIMNFGHFEYGFDVFAQNTISRVEKVADLLREISQKYTLQDKKIVTAVPAPSVFTKKQRLPVMDLEEMREHIEFEAPNFIPHGADSVYLDFHVIGKAGKNHYEVMIVAVKKDVVDRFVEVFDEAGLSVGIVDVDQFALQNCFEFNYPSLVEKTVSLVNIGGRYTGINICRGGNCLFAGDISLGGKTISEEISKEMEISIEEAEKLKLNLTDEKASLIVEEFVEHSVSELSRQLSYFWNASGAEGGIDNVLLSGGTSLLGGLIEKLREELGCDVSILDPFTRVNFADGLDKDQLISRCSQFAQTVGLAQRSFGDRQESVD
jgi:type IV pilus assembly protein PilM